MIVFYFFKNLSKLVYFLFMNANIEDEKTKKTKTKRFWHIILFHFNNDEKIKRVAHRMFRCVYGDLLNDV